MISKANGSPFCKSAILGSRIILRPWSKIYCFVLHYVFEHLRKRLVTEINRHAMLPQKKVAPKAIDECVIDVLTTFCVECIYLINQARGPYWENNGPRSWQYGPSAARSVQKRPTADILPVRSRASFVNKRFIFRLKKALKVSSSKGHKLGSFGTMPGPILREYWTGNRAF